jgi:hypothetical protein
VAKGFVLYNPEVRNHKLKPMVLSASQPIFCPYPGFFYKAWLSDVLVLLDTVQFPRGASWLSRNRFKNDQGELWLTVPVWKKGLGLQNIDQVRICPEGRWRRKHREALRSAYGRAPYLADHLDFINEMFSDGFERLLDLNLAVIQYLMRCLRISTRLVLLSELGITSRGPRLLPEICQALEADTFLALSQTKKYLEPARFAEKGIKLTFFRYTAPVFPQLWGEFLANLSTFDPLFTCGPRAQEIIIRQQAGVGGAP